MTWIELTLSFVWKQKLRIVIYGSLVALIKFAYLPTYYYWSFNNDKLHQITNIDLSKEKRSYLEKFAYCGFDGFHYDIYSKNEKWFIAY